MWDPEHFPGADHVPWQLLIRARFAFEIDAVIASHVVRALSGVLPAKEVAGLSRLATRIVAAGPRDEVTGEATVVALRGLAEFDEECGTKWPRWPFPWPGPWPGPRFEEDLVDPIAVVVLDAARDFIRAGSPEFQKEFGASLDGLTRGFAR